MHCLLYVTEALNSEITEFCIYIQGGSKQNTPPENMQYLRNQLSDFKGLNRD